MPKKFAEVEIVPWLHSFDYHFHGSAIEFIRSMPKNSSLAFELSEKSLRDVRRDPKQALEIFLRAKDLKTRDNILAGYEVLHECTKRNIGVLPVQSHSLYLRPRDLFNQVQDASFASALKTQLSRYKGKELHFLVGISHVPGVQEELKKLGINSRVKMDIFGQDKRSMEHLVALSRETRDMALGSKKALAAKGVDLLFANMLDSRRGRGSNEIIQNMFSEIEERKQTAQKRIERKRKERSKKSTRPR